MKPNPRIVFLAAVAAAFVLGGAGCSVGHRVASHLEDARKYYIAGKLDQAEIEYITVLQLRQLDPDAIAGLALVYFDEGRTGRVYTYLSKARELQPNNLEVRKKLAIIYESAGRFEDARKEAVYVLSHNADDGDAPVLLSDASTNAAEVSDARARLARLPPSAARSAPVLVATAILDLKERRVADAEAELNRARERDPKLAIAYGELARIYAGRNDLKQAEQMFAKAAVLSPIRSNLRIQYANFELRTGHADVAEAALGEIITKAPDCLPPYLALAEIYAGQKKMNEALTLVGKALARDPAQPEAISLAARLHLAKGEPKAAVSELESAVGTFGQSPQLRYQLAVAYVISGDLAKASSTLRDVLRLQPDFPAATMMLADVQTRQNNTSGAIATLQDLAKRHPQLAETKLALAAAYFRQRSFDQAIELYQALSRAAPRDPRLPVLIGIAYAQQDKPALARQSFEKAMALAPGFLTALDQLVNLDLQEHRYDAGLKRVLAVCARDPHAAGPYMLLAKIYVAEGDTKNAEATLKRVIALQPDQALPYMMLARLYVTNGLQDKAIANLKEASARSPKDTQPLMLIASLYDTRKNYSSAREYYEKLLSIDPNFAAALNNLAYLYAERFNQLDKAFTLAQRAHELVPNDPHVEDTLGWILYNRRQFSWALTLLSDSADKLPGSADIQMHVGMARYMLGDGLAARTSLERALKLSASFEGAAMARRSLAILEIDPARAADRTIEELEKGVQASPDPIALTRLGQVYERRNEGAKAREAYDSALKASPNNLQATLGLIRLDRADRRFPQALAMAQAARTLAPENTEVTLLLGELAFENGQYAWSASLLQGVVRDNPANMEAQYTLGRARYATGQVEGAEASLTQAVAGGLPSPDLANAKRYLEMIGISRAAAPTNEAAVADILRKEPDFVPALFAMGRIEEAKHETAAAVISYRKVLASFPDFAPATKRLVVLLSSEAGPLPADIAKLAEKARTAFPDDSEVGKACGILAYRQGDYPRALSLLEETSVRHDGDFELLYYLGMSEYHLDRKKDSKRSLEAFLKSKSRPDLAGEARRVLAELR